MADRGDYQGSGLALVDDKGRVAIPNALRATLAGNAPRADGKDGGTVIIAVHEDRPCLVAYDPAHLATLKAELMRRVELSRGTDGKVDDNILRDGANGEAVPFDGSGRFIMPGYPRFHAAIGINAFFWGMLETFEIWDPRTLIATPGLAPRMVAACKYHCQDKGIAL